MQCLHVQGDSLHEAFCWPMLIVHEQAGSFLSSVSYCCQCQEEEVSGCKFASQDLQRVMEPLAKAAAVLPPAALRADPAVAVTIARYLPRLLQVLMMKYQGAL